MSRLTAIVLMSAACSDPRPAALFSLSSVAARVAEFPAGRLAASDKLLVRVTVEPNAEPTAPDTYRAEGYALPSIEPVGLVKDVPFADVVHGDGRLWGVGVGPTRHIVVTELLGPPLSLGATSELDVVLEPGMELVETVRRGGRFCHAVRRDPDVVGVAGCGGPMRPVVSGGCVTLAFGASGDTVACLVPALDRVEVVELGTQQVRGTFRVRGAAEVVPAASGFAVSVRSEEGVWVTTLLDGSATPVQSWSGLELFEVRDATSGWLAGHWSLTDVPRVGMLPVGSGAPVVGGTLPNRLSSAVAVWPDPSTLVVASTHGTFEVRLDAFRVQVSGTK